MRRRRATYEETTCVGIDRIIRLDSVGGLGFGPGFLADSGQTGQCEGLRFRSELRARNAAGPIHTGPRSGDRVSGRLPVRAAGFANERENRARAESRRSDLARQRRGCAAAYQPGRETIPDAGGGTQVDWHVFDPSTFRSGTYASDGFAAWPAAAAQGAARVRAAYLRAGPRANRFAGGLLSVG